MKANSIIIAFVALASQISSASGILDLNNRLRSGTISLSQTTANPESVNTLEGRAITVDVLANDNPTIDNNNPTIVNQNFNQMISTMPVSMFVTNINEEFSLILFFQPVIVQGTETGVAGAGAGVTTRGAADGTILYTPANGFVGTVTFEYQIATVNPVRRSLLRGRRLNGDGGGLLTGIVTVTVTAKDIRPDFKALNQFSTDSAIAAVSFSPALNNNVFQNLQNTFANFFAFRGGV
jgi:hypothetical protein